MVFFEFFWEFSIGPIWQPRLLDDGTPELFFYEKWVPICGHWFWDNDFGATYFCQLLAITSGLDLPTSLASTGNITSYHGPNFPSQNTTKVYLESDGIKIGRCTEEDIALYDNPFIWALNGAGNNGTCTGGCNDMQIGGLCYQNNPLLGNCTAGEPAGIKISCSLPLI